MQNKKEKKEIVVAESSSEEEREENSIDEVQDESEKDAEVNMGESEADSGAEDDENGVEDAGDGEEESSEDEELKNLGNEGSKNAEINFSDKSFEELGIGLQNNLMNMADCIPKILEGSVVLGCAKTRTGKTLAFALPVLQKLAVDPYGIFPVILTPTRELATQISDQFIAFGRPLNLQVCTVTGGRDIMAQGNELSRQPHIVATPGRLADYIESDPVTIGRLFK